MRVAQTLPTPVRTAFRSFHLRQHLQPFSPPHPRTPTPPTRMKKPRNPSGIPRHFSSPLRQTPVFSVRESHPAAAADSTTFGRNNRTQLRPDPFAAYTARSAAFVSCEAV